MKNIQILGTGCTKCQKLIDNAETAGDELGIDYKIEKVADINDIMDFGVMMTPALVVNGEVKVMGKVATVEEIKELIQ